VNIFDSNYLLKERVNTNTAELAYFKKHLNNKEAFSYYYKILSTIPKETFFLIWSTPDSFLWSKLMWCLLFKKNDSVLITTYCNWKQIDINKLLDQLINDLGIFVISSHIILKKDIFLKYPITIQGKGLFPGTEFGWQTRKLKIKSYSKKYLLFEDYKYKVGSKDFIDFEEKSDSKNHFFKLNKIESTSLLIDILSESARMNFDGMEWIERINDKDKINKFLATLKKSLSLLKNYNRELYDEFNHLIIKVVPLKVISSAVPSSSNSVILRTIFLTYTDNEFLLVEMLIHELSHNKLFLIQEIDPLLNTEIHGDGWSNERYYSPWRSDKRPFNGLFHAAYVFTEVTKFWYKEIKSFNKKDYENIAFKRFYVLTEQLKIAYQILNENGAFTDKGLEIIKYIEKNILIFSKEIDEEDLLNTEVYYSELDFDRELTDLNVNISIKEHRRKWENNY
jgi:hypothetical protein